MRHRYFSEVPLDNSQILRMNQQVDILFDTQFNLFQIP